MIELLMMIALTQLPVLLFGGFIAFLPTFRRTSLQLRIAAAWLAGTALIAIVSPLLALAGTWGERSIAIPLALLSVGVAVTARKRVQAADHATIEGRRGRTRPSATAIGLIAASLALLAWGIASGRAISAKSYEIELARAEVWSHAGIDPAIPGMSAAAPPLASISPMWSSMLRSEAALQGGAWLALILLLCLIPVFASAFRDLLQASSRLATASVAAICAIAVVAGSLGGSEDAWLLMLAPALVALAAARRNPPELQILCGALVSLAHPAGLAVSLAIATGAALRGQREAAVRIGAAGVIALIPWWILLFARGVHPWAPGVINRPAGWYPADAALLLVCGVSLVLVVARLRRLPHSLQALLTVAAIVIGAALWTASTRDFWLLSLRLASPVVLLAALLLTLRPIPVKKRLRSVPA